MNQRDERLSFKTVSGIDASDQNRRNFARLSWQCRRGMLELDILLQGFLQREFANLDTEQIQALERLLEMPDQLLLEYLMGRTIPIDKEVVDIVQHIRSAVNHPS